MNAIETTHKLDFLSKPWERDPEWHVFKIGTCNGQWRATDESYDILTIINEEPGNGHLTDVLEWFEFACKRDGKMLRILEVWNKRFYKHLIEKKGFIDSNRDGENVVKFFK
jgi:hypothetical protein